MGPLLTLKVQEALQSAARKGTPVVECSLDLDRSRTSVEVRADHWSWQAASYPFLAACKDRTIYYWAGQEFAPVARYTNSLIKLVPTDWGPPTFEIDGIKMLPTAKVSPYEDAQRKVGLIRPRGKAILDTCGGLGYFAAWCLQGQAASVLSFEKNPDVIWLRSLNPWSPQAQGMSPQTGVESQRDDVGAVPWDGTRRAPSTFAQEASARDTSADGRPSSGASGSRLVGGDIAIEVASLPDRAFDAVLHDPPRFGIAGELYSQAFYDHLARVLRPRGILFHYTGTPNKLTSGRDVPKEVARRLRQAGFSTGTQGDGVLAVRR
jgi:predicted methyltransferase